MPGTQYVHDGTDWVDVFSPPPTPAPDVQNFTSSGTWNMPAGARYVFVELIGGGGSGSLEWNTGNVSGSAPGGGGGGYACGFYDADDLNASESVTVGSGGAAVNKKAISIFPGNAGGNSSFKGLTATGGYGGMPFDSGTGVGGGMGGGSGLIAGTFQSYNGNPTYDSSANADHQYAGGRGAASYAAAGAAQPNVGFGAGGGGYAGSSGSGSPGNGGVTATALGRLKAGNGGAGAYINAGSTPPAGGSGNAPGGGGGSAAWSKAASGVAAESGAGARGAVRITTYF